MERHYRILSVLYIVYGIFNVLFSVLVYFILGRVFAFADVEPEVVEFVHAIGIPLAIAFVILSILSVIGGIAITQGKKWSKVLLLILGCFFLLNFPLGTIIGIYTIVVYVSDAQNKIRTTGA